MYGHQAERGVLGRVQEKNESEVETKKSRNRASEITVAICLYVGRQ